MMGPGMFDGFVRDLILIGIAIGLGIAGLLWFGAWLWSHISFAWH